MLRKESSKPVFKPSCWLGFQTCHIAIIFLDVFRLVNALIKKWRQGKKELFRCGLGPPRCVTEPSLPSVSFNPI